MTTPPLPPTKRTLFYDVTETENQTIYRFKYSWLIYVVLIVGFSLWFATLQLHILPEYFFYCYIALAGIYFVINFICHEGPNSEIRAAALSGSVRYSGSKFSVSHPIMVTIDRMPKHAMQRNDLGHTSPGSAAALPPSALGGRLETSGQKDIFVLKTDASDSFAKPSRTLEEFTAKQVYISQSPRGQNSEELSQPANVHKAHFVIWGVSTLLLAVLFILITTGSTMYWYRQGAGRHYAISRTQGIEHSLAAAQGHTSGILYSAFTVCGLSLPLTLLLSTTLAILLFHNDKKYKAARWILFFGICAMGSVSMAVAQHILSHGVTPLFMTFVSTTFIWTAIALCFLSFIGVIALIRLIFRKRQNA